MADRKGMRAGREEMEQAIKARMDTPQEAPPYGNEQQLERRRRQFEELSKAQLPPGWQPPKTPMTDEERADFLRDLRAAYGEPKKVKTSAVKEREREPPKRKPQRKDYRRGGEA